MNKVVCRCNHEFGTIVELLEHYEHAHSAKAVAPAYDSVQYRRVTYKPRKPRLATVRIIRLGPAYFEPEKKAEPQAIIPNDL